MPIVRREEDVEYLRRLRTLLPRAEKLVGLDQEYNMRFCGLGWPSDCFYLISDAAYWWREFRFECSQLMNVRGRQFMD